VHYSKNCQEPQSLNFGILGGGPDDLIGVAFAWGQPQDRTLRDQYVLEAFYRVQVFPYIQLTPDLQVIFNPSKNRNDSTIVILGLRTRVLF